MINKANIGGYKILDFTECPLTTGSTSATLANVFSTIANNNNKPILVNNLIIDGSLQQPFYVYFKLSSGSYIADLGGYDQLNITSDNHVYISSTAPAPQPTPFTPNVLDLSEVGETIWSRIMEVEGTYDTVSAGNVVLHGVPANSGTSAPILPDFTGQFFRYDIGSQDILFMQLVTGWDATNNVPIINYFGVSEDDDVGIVSTPEDFIVS